MVEPKVISVGLMSTRDLDVLRTGLPRCFPLVCDDLFTDLLIRLDVPATPAKRAGVGSAGRAT